MLMFADASTNNSWEGQVFTNYSMDQSQINHMAVTLSLGATLEKKTRHEYTRHMWEALFQLLWHSIILTWFMAGSLPLAYYNMP